MSKRQAKKLNLALYLNPVVSEADRVAMDALQHWYEKTKQSYPDPNSTDLDTVVRVFHHDIYLAGLHLYLINPRLCHFVAEALAQGETSLEALVQQLTACGLWPSSPQASPQAEDAGPAFSTVQLEQLEKLLANLPSPPASEPDGPVATAADPALLERLGEQQALLNNQHELLTEQRDQLAQQQAQLAQQGKQLTSMLEELQRLRTQAQEQARQLQQLRLSGNGSGAPAPTPEPARASGPEEMDVSNMSAQLAQMEKVRKKGLF